MTYAYDPENRLISMHNYTGSRYTYAYWADGLRRYAQEPSSPIVTQIWDGQDLLMEKSPTGTARYIAHQGEVFGEKRGDTRYLYLPDPLGSVVALLDNAQTITDSFIYLPYGEEQVRTGSTTSNLRWLGRWGYRRDYTNRAYVRARVMRTDFGKWMTEDPLGLDAGDENLYRYVGGNPMTAVDPGGTFGHPAVCAIACSACAFCVEGAYLTCDYCGSDIDCWKECLVRAWPGLPRYAQAICIGGCAGCFACIGKALQPIVVPPLLRYIFVECPDNPWPRYPKWLGYCLAQCVMGFFTPTPGGWKEYLWPFRGCITDCVRQLW